MDQQLENHNFSEHIVNLGETTKKLGKVVNYYNKCDYTSTRPSNFKMHLKTHTAEKPNKCKQCDFSFVRASDLRMHLKRHSGEKSNKCNQCDYASSQAGDLRKHLKTHRSGEMLNK